MQNAAIRQRRIANSGVHLATEPLRKGDAIWLLLLTAAAVGLRTLCLASRSLTTDEGVSTFLARTTATNFSAMVWRSEFNMILYYSLLRLWMHLGHSEYVVRLLSVLLSAATVPVIFFLGLRLFGRKAALIAAVLLVVHPSHLLLAQEARSYSLVVLLVSLSSLFFLRLLQSPSRTNWVLYGVLSAAAVYSHFFAALVIAAQWPSLLIFPRSLPWRALIASALLLVVLLVPVAVFLLHSGVAQVGWIPNTGFRQVQDVLYFWTLSKARCLTYIALWIVAVWSALRSRRIPEAWSYWFTIAWLFVPLMILVALSLNKPLLVPRYLAISIPAALLLAAAGLVQLAHWSRVGAALVLLLIVFYSGSAIRFYDRHPESSVDWRGAFAYLLARVQSGDEIVMDPFIEYVFDYYRDASGRATTMVIAGSLTSPLPTIPPQNIWAISSVLVNPHEKLPKADMQSEVKTFLATHGQLYCGVPPRPESASVQVWQMRRCDRQ